MTLIKTNKSQSRYKDNNAAIDHYRSEFLADIPSQVRSSCLEELMSRMAQKRICFVGDFHTLSDSQDIFCKIITHYFIHNPSQKVAIGLEFLSPRHQKWIDAYLRHGLSDQEFLKKVGYKWPYAWKDFGMILTLARKFNFYVFGTYKSTSLEQRDVTIAKSIHNHLEGFHKVFVLLGEFHLSSSHVLRFFPTGNFVCILPNIEQFYPQCIQEFTSVQTYNDFFFIAQTSPWMKWKSYRIWEDNLLGADLADHVESVLDEICTQFDLDDFKPDLSKLKFEIPEIVSAQLERDGILQDSSGRLFYLKDSQIRTLLILVAHLLGLSKTLLNRKWLSHLLLRKLDPFYSPKTWIEPMDLEDHGVLSQMVDCPKEQHIQVMDRKYDGFASSYLASILFDRMVNGMDELSLASWLRSVE